MPSKKTQIVLSEKERREIERISRSQVHAHRSVVRAQLILRLAAGQSVRSVAKEVGVERRIVMKWEKRFREKRLEGLEDAKRSGRPAHFPPPLVTLYLVKLACELPDAVDRSLSLWTCAELARTAQRDKVVDSISPQSVQRILHSHKLKPWRVHHWLSAKVNRDEAFRATVLNLLDLYTRTLAPNERVLCLDEKTSLQPRPRTSATRPARRGNVPVRLEHEYRRAGALNLFAAFDTRSGEVIGICRRRKRQIELIELLEKIDRETPKSIEHIHLVCDNVSTHHGKLARTWLAQHPRFHMHFTPVHCSWMNQVEQWFSILQRKRFAAPNFADLNVLEQKIDAFISEWNEIKHPFKWNESSFDKVLAKIDAKQAA